ncbi:SDR family oxidoreductase [Halostella sp. JP-L12]|uniref:SDR family oxidoreductase n=1 Tax=Halostella TaxID=1843185 RepID=UPI000EF7B81D|nr:MULTISPECIES: SDR family oxidoreductase [Halostella]NHN47963.1 SDR family oxidoreductase [Halostella sp. JP-L12]
MEEADDVAVVTGASSGIGEATARALGREGYAVALVARREDRLEAIAEEIATRTLVVPTDVTDETAVAAMVETVREELGGVDVLVNNAGIARGGPVGEADLTEMRRTVRVNLEGVMNVTHAALPEILESGGGDIVTVSSMSARFPQEGGSAYSASKFGVNGFCRSLRKELSDEQVRVTIVMPGPVVTELNDWEHWDGRPMAPTDVAESIVFAVSRPDHVEIPDITVNTTDKLD